MRDHRVVEPAGDLVECRMATLGLDPCTIAACEPRRFDAMQRRCRLCDLREACTVDLRRDPNNPVWESYCPNTGRLLAFANELWLGNWAAWASRAVADRPADRN
jgi:hypothetical protein